jgi:hypothetical protein
MKKQLKNITLLSYNPVDPIRSIKALLYSSRDIEFARMVLVSRTKPKELPDFIDFVHTNNTTHQESSHFVYNSLPNIVDTEYMLSIHDDGFVINPHLWRDEFLDYDYIGAPWRELWMRNRVGNGGFVLKSNRFIQLTRNLTYLGKHEDGELTNDYYDYFTANGCRYAPVHVAMKFSIESRIPECEYNLNNCFGFHGRGNPKDVRVHDGFYHQFQEKCQLLDTVEIHP